MTFIEYLKTTDLTENLIQYVWLCIAMTEKNASALEVTCLSSNQLTYCYYVGITSC